MDLLEDGSSDLVSNGYLQFIFKRGIQGRGMGPKFPLGKGARRKEGKGGETKGD